MHSKRRGTSDSLFSRNNMSPSNKKRYLREHIESDHLLSKPCVMEPQCAVFYYQYMLCNHHSHTRASREEEREEGKS